MGPGYVGDEGLRPSAGRRMTLTQLIEAEIIPRLLMCHRGWRWRRSASRPGRGRGNIVGERDAFARLFLAGDRTEILKRLERAMDDGVGPGLICRDLLAPVAQSLRVEWEERRCSFADLMRGLVCLDAVLRDLRRSRSGADLDGESAPHAPDGALQSPTRN